MKKLKFVKKHLKTIVISVISFVFICLGLITFWFATFRVPDLKSFDDRIVLQSTKIYDRTGEILLFDVNQDIKRKVVPYEEISNYVKKATVAIEDADFYEHGGIKVTAIVRAVLSNLTGGSTQGGSTITQQVIKNSLLTSEKIISRKIKEWVLAIKLEKVMTKEEILEIYLNESPYGGSIYGVEEASQTFFGKKSADVTLAEAAYLAAIPNAPTFYSPYGNNKDRLDNRKNLVLEKMLEHHFITEKEYGSSKNEVVVFKTREGNSIKAPHFVDFVRQYLEDKYGEKMVREGGLKIITTLDYSLQSKAEEIAKKYALENKKTFDAENAAVVAIDPKTGQILVMVGSRDYFDKEIDGNFNVAVAHRQPGSAFKPFVYATAFEKGYTPDTVVFDLPTQFQTTCNYQGVAIGGGSSDECYMPNNYDGKFVGPITFRNALAQSRNIPAIKVLYLAGITDSIKTAEKMGITSLGDKNQYGLTLVLGGGEVSPLEMTSAYGVFATQGIKNSHTPILKIEDASGKILEEFSLRSEQVIAEEITNKISSILSDNVARTPMFGANSSLYFADRPVAVKTGTSNDFRDSWVVGYTPNLVVGAWAGNNDNRPVDKKTSGMVVAPLWHAFMNEALKTLPKEYFTEPEPTPKEIKPVFRGIWQGYNYFTIDTVSGKLATDLTPPETQKEVYETNVHEILYWVNKSDPHGEIPQNPANDPQFKYWEYPVEQWLKTQYLPSPVKPTDRDDVHTNSKKPKIKIISPNTDERYAPDQKITIQTSLQSSYPVSKMDFYINENYLGSSSLAPFLFSFMPNEISAVSRGKNTLKIVATDSAYNRSEEEIEFTVTR
ncbi:MAG: PBP1A family penicillin-binding protein [Candidatus Paceibacterota bacterium]